MHILTGRELTVQATDSFLFSRVPDSVHANCRHAWGERESDIKSLSIRIGLDR